LGKENGLSYAELVETSRVLIVGGAETTATLLTGLLYYLRSYSGASAEASLTTDIRTAFSSSDKITLSSLQKIPSYNNNKITELDACINEGLRLFPPLPGNLRRIVGEGGKWISGKYVWPGTLVAVDILAANLSSANFHLPNEFRPERWMGYTAEFAEDKLDVVQPVSIFRCPLCCSEIIADDSNSSRSDHVTALARIWH
jgi:cytochrome P450